MRTSYKYYVDGISFELAEEIDIQFIREYGKILHAFDQNDSGNISFIVESDKKYFLKVAGLKTCNSDLDASVSIRNLRNAKDIYSDIDHINIVKPIKYEETDRYALLLFPYVEGECLFDHWNFEYYKKNGIISPLQNFLTLDCGIRLQFVNDLFDFYEVVNKSGYIATDFYEGSIIYNFKNNTFRICDLDFFTKNPSVNTTGFQWGPERFLAPEEKTIGQLLDTRTDIYHLGAFINIVFTDFQTKKWQLSDSKYDVIKMAMSIETGKRFKSFVEFKKAWSEVQ